MRRWAEDARERSPWLTVAAVCGALLFLPLVAWLALGGRIGVAPPPPARPAAAATVAATVAPERHSPGAPVRLAPRPAAAEAPGASVAGVVLDPSGAPVAGATVSCTYERGQPVLTDEKGRFELPNETSGSQGHASHPLFGPSEVVWLGAGGDNTLRLTNGGAIAGTVVDEHGAAVPSFVLSVDSFVQAATLEAPPQLGRSFKVDDPGGAFLWQGLLAGRYVLSASAAERPPAVTEPITVELGKTSGGVRIVLSRGARLSGKVTDGDTRSPLEGATVGLEGASWPGASAVASARTDASGTYALVGVPPGPFSVRVTRDGYRLRVVTGLVTRGAPELHEDVALHRADGGAGIETAGVGVLLSDGPGGVVVLGVVPETAGARGDVKRGDRLLRIDGATTDGLTATQCMQRLSCREGAQVRLGLGREGASAVEVTLLCEAIVR